MIGSIFAKKNNVITIENSSFISLTTNSLGCIFLFKLFFEKQFYMQ